MNLTTDKLAWSNVVDQLQCTVCLQKIERCLYFLVPGEIIYKKWSAALKLYDSRFKPLPVNLRN